MSVFVTHSLYLSGKGDAKNTIESIYGYIHTFLFSIGRSLYNLNAASIRLLCEASTALMQTAEDMTLHAAHRVYGK